MRTLEVAMRIAVNLEWSMKDEKLIDDIIGVVNNVEEGVARATIDLLHRLKDTNQGRPFHYLPRLILSLTFKNIFIGASFK